MKKIKQSQEDSESETIMSETKEVKFKSSKPKSGIRYVNPKQLAEAGASNEILVQGTFLGRTEENQFGKRDWKFESMNERGEDGSPVLIIINDAGNLNYRMTSNGVNVGDLVQIRYMGQEKIAEGKLKGKAVHQFEVDTAEG